MTRFPALFAALCLFATIATAEETPGDPLSLIPELPAPVAKPKPNAAPAKKSATEQASDDMQSRIRYREAKTKVLQDPRFQAEWDRAHAAKTDPERREILKDYYTLFCDRMLKVDPTLRPRVEVLRRSLAWRFPTNMNMGGRSPIAREREKQPKPATVGDPESLDD